MHGDENEGGNAKGNGEEYESTVLDFLQKEISAPANSGEPRNSASDEVDLLVDNFLKEAITVAEKEESPRETEAEDFDHLLSRIFTSQSETPPASPVPDAAAELPQALQANSWSGQSHNETVPIGASLPQTAAFAPAARSAPAGTAEVPPPSPVVASRVSVIKETTPDRKPEAPAVEPGVPSDRAFQFGFVPEKKRFNARLVLVLGGALVCLLAGAGILFFSGSRSGPENKPDASAAPEVQPAPANTAASMATANLPEAEKSTKGAAPQVSRPAPGVANAGAGARANVPLKGVNPPATDPSVSAGTVNSAIDSVPAAPAAEKAAPPVNSASDQLLRAAENPSSLAALQTQAPTSSTLANLTPRTSRPNLEGLGSLGRSAEPAPPAPRVLVPVSVISKVAPQYPDIARRTRTTGTVVIEVQVDENGKAVKATPESGPMMLRTEAVNAVMQWKFKPASINGTNVAGTIKVSLVFQGPR